MLQAVDPGHCSEGIGPEDTGNEPLALLLLMIVRSMDVEKIYLLGTWPLLPEALGVEYDLLVLVKNTRRPMDELESLIRNRSQDLPAVHASVYPISKVNDWIGKGNYFFGRFCTEELLVYDDGRIPVAIRPEGISTSAPS